MQIEPIEKVTAVEEVIRRFKIRFIQESLTVQPDQKQMETVARSPSIDKNIATTVFQNEHKQFVKLHLQN